MAQSKFLQIHTLTSYPASLLNRDDAGFAKRIPFGGTTRTRVSSQCLKFHWRNFQGAHALKSLNIPHSIRSRQTFTQKVARPLVDDGYPKELVAAAVTYLRDLLLSGKAPTKGDVTSLLKDKEMDLQDALDTPQVVVLGEPEVNYLRSIVRDKLDSLREELTEAWEQPESDLSKEQMDLVWSALSDLNKGDMKKNLKALSTATGIEAAMFGRMTTSDMLARSDAAVHVAHAFTTHAEESESDYFTAVDELKSDSEEGELGGGHLNTTELASGLFYGYIVVDVPLLVSNLEGCKRSEWAEADRTLAATAVEHLLHLISTVSPGAKLGSTAPYAYSECVLVESGSVQPRTLANAFRKPVDARGGTDVLAGSYQSLGQYLSAFEAMYGKNTNARLAAMGPVEKITGACDIDGPVPMDQLAAWTAEQVRG